MVFAAVLATAAASSPTYRPTYSPPTPPPYTPPTPPPYYQSTTPQYGQKVPQILSQQFDLRNDGSYESRWEERL